MVKSTYSWFKGKSCRPLTAPFDITLIKTRRNDMLKKLDLYMQTSVKEYWIADPAKKEVYGFKKTSRGEQCSPLQQIMVLKIYKSYSLYGILS